MMLPLPMEIIDRVHLTRGPYRGRYRVKPSDLFGVNQGRCIALTCGNTNSAGRHGLIQVSLMQFRTVQRICLLPICSLPCSPIARSCRQEVANAIGDFIGRRRRRRMTLPLLDPLSGNCGARHVVCISVPISAIAVGGGRLRRAGLRFRPASTRSAGPSGSHCAAHQGLRSAAAVLMLTCGLMQLRSVELSGGALLREPRTT